MKRLLSLTLLPLAAAVYTVDTSALNSTFYGIGGLSAGASSRALYDYPDPARDQILDYLFKPNFGASFQILKVEIGGDSQSTDGTEASHMHSEADLNYERGYEWWLMVEAKKRNPDIKIYGLPWAFPGWVGAPGNPYADPAKTASYVTKWVEGAKTQYNIDVDYLGVWNERSSSAAYVSALRKSLNTANFSNIKIVARDGSADICGALASDPSYAADVDIIGLHYPSDYAQYTTCQELDKPIWSSEESSSYDDANGALCWVRVITSHWVLSGMTSSIIWALIGAMYHGTGWYGAGAMTSVQPWSGNYGNFDVLWATAHYTQFTKTGWQYVTVGKGSGQLVNGGYYATLAGDGEFSMIIAKVPHDHASCVRPTLPYENVTSEVATFQLAQTDRRTLNVWYSNFLGGSDTEVFQQRAPITPAADGTFTITINVGDVLTLSTLKTASKGSYGTPPPSSSFTLPYADTFDSVPINKEARYLSDQIGSFESQPSVIDANKKVMKQMVPQLPIGWSDPGTQGPLSLVGMKEWEDINITASFLVPTTNASACVGNRVSQMSANGILLCVGGDGTWTLTYSGMDQATGKPRSNTLIASGVATGFKGVMTVNSMTLVTVGQQASGYLNGGVLFHEGIRVGDCGMSSIGANSWYPVEFHSISLSQAGGDWNPEPACTPKVGAQLFVKNCKANGVSSAGLEFDLTPTWQIRHRSSGYCVTAAAEDMEKVTLQECVLGPQVPSLQQFPNDYSNIRNAPVPLPLGADGNLYLVGTVTNETVFLTTTTPPGGWWQWVYFPNSHQLRNQYTYDETLGYPLCLAAC